MSKKLILLALSIMVAMVNNVICMDNQYGSALGAAVSSGEKDKILSILNVSTNASCDAKSVYAFACIAGNPEIKKILWDRINEDDRKQFFLGLLQISENIKKQNHGRPGVYVTMPWLNPSIGEIHFSDPETFPLNDDIKLKLLSEKDLR